MNKHQLANTMLTREERSKHIPVFDSMAWKLRKFARMMRVSKNKEQFFTKVEPVEVKLSWWQWIKSFFI